MCIFTGQKYFKCTPITQSLALILGGKPAFCQQSSRPRASPLGRSLLSFKGYLYWAKLAFCNIHHHRIWIHRTVVDWRHEAGKFVKEKNAVIQSFQHEAER